MKSLFSLKVNSSNMVRRVALEGRLVSLTEGRMKKLGDILYSSNNNFFQPDHIVNVGTSIVSAFSVFLVVFVIFSEYCTTTCQKNKMKKTTKSIRRITAFMARPYVTLAIVKVLLILCPLWFLI